ncbi:hypothetical protein [Haloprofundus salilacus]|uniref:hypothetical protein n=1 Tax=Haloprofundus salilacus TaxID=2876190 RepID=UPI001CCB18DB|nr:hypothetical protein [Haloprofundus salilacus]
MPNRCPYLDYRRETGGRSFEAARPYCTAAETFVQPMRADICVGRYGLDHAADCEIYLAHEGERDADYADDSDGGDGE